MPGFRGADCPKPLQRRCRLCALLGLVMSMIVGQASADCFQKAARYQNVNVRILKAIAWQESRAHPQTLHRNANGSIDYGQMQINSIHLPTLAQYGVTRATLMDSCASIYIGAWHLRRMMDKYGNTWAAVGAYHSETPYYRDDYAASVRRIIESDRRFARFERGDFNPRHSRPLVHALPRQPNQATLDTDVATIP